MERDNATNRDRKSGVRGTKKTGRSPTIAFPMTILRPPVRGAEPSREKQWKQIIIPRTLLRTWGTRLGSRPEGYH